VQQPQPSSVAQACPATVGQVRNIFVRKKCNRKTWEIESVARTVIYTKFPALFLFPVRRNKLCRFSISWKLWNIIPQFNVCLSLSANFFVNIAYNLTVPVSS
jgi:hypothetical protein